MVNVLSTSKRVAIVSALCEGMSVRATARMMDVSKDTVLKLMVELGEVCSRYMDETLRDLTCKRLQVDEIRDFATAKPRTSRRTRRVFLATGISGLLLLLTRIPSSSRHF